MGEKRARQLLEAGSIVTVVSKEFTNGLKSLGELGKVQLIEEVVRTEAKLEKLVGGFDLVIAATDEKELNSRIMNEGRKTGAWVYAVDDPNASDFSFPASTKVGELTLAVSTGGKSPLIARMVCERLSKHINEKDSLWVELQHYARELAKKRIPDPDERRKFLNRLVKDRQIGELISQGKLEEARRLVSGVIEAEG
jgi:precorrin-2 dehydrogenase/sirohydrochlorin ferrochelatase